MKTTTTVKKWGNSLAIRIPWPVVQELKLADDTQLQLTSNGKSLTLQPKATKKVSLEQLLDTMTPDNVHDATDWGGPVGKEVW